jgi:hypothetical protein
MKYFISYGNDKFINSKIRIKQQAESINLFDRIITYSPEDIPDDIINNIRDYINLPRGGGYWIWKPIIIKLTLDIMEDDDILVYADSGCTINEEGRNKMIEYFEMINNPIKPILAFSMYHIEKKWTNNAVFDYFEIDESSPHRNSGQICATATIIRKCDISMDIINKWYEVATLHPILFTDELNHLHGPDFIDNRHDQSSFSLLLKLNACLYLSYN